MKRTITGMALVSALVFTAIAWSQESPMKHGKMGMGEMETKNASLDGLVGRMHTVGGAKKIAAMENC